LFLEGKHGAEASTARYFCRGRPLGRPVRVRKRWSARFAR
jgi:hypothetical protein